MPDYLLYILLTFLLCPAVAEAAKPVVLFNLQPQHIPMFGWFDNFTLCFAPLIAHLVGGVISPIVIPSHSKPPSWWAYLPHFNPISVIWRWYAIADRRLRACSWDAADMAACNAVFWDAKKARWDGSEDIMLRSRAWIINIPERRYASLLSIPGLTTVVLAFQGVHAVTGIYFRRYHSFQYQSRAYPAEDFNLTVIFVFIAIMSLFRLPAALWLTADYVYWNVSQRRIGGERDDADLPERTMEEADGSFLELDSRTSKRATTTTAAVSLLSAGPANLSQLSTTDEPRVHSPHTKIGLAYRIWWVISVHGVITPCGVFAALSVFRIPQSFPYMSLTTLLGNLMYFVLSVSSVSIITTYVLMGRTQTTIIPCIHATWYKVLTMVLAALALATVIVATLETRQTRDGNLTTFPEFHCNNSTGICVPVANGQGNAHI